MRMEHIFGEFNELTQKKHIKVGVLEGIFWVSEDKIIKIKLWLIVVTHFTC